MPLEPPPVKVVSRDWREELGRLLHQHVVGYRDWDSLLESTREAWRSRAAIDVARLQLDELLEERNKFAQHLQLALSRARRYAGKIDEARRWARHGYEIGQRSCTWTDDHDAPLWLTEGHDPEALRGKEPVSSATMVKILNAQIAGLQQRVVKKDKAYIELAEAHNKATAQIAELQNQVVEKDRAYVRLSEKYSRATAQIAELQRQVVEKERAYVRAVAKHSRATEYVRKMQDISEAAVNNEVAFRVGIAELLKVIEKFDTPRYIRDLDPELQIIHDMKVGLNQLLDAEKALDEAPPPDMGTVNAAERASMSRVTNTVQVCQVNECQDNTEVSGPDRETLNQEAVAVIGPKILSTSAMPQMDTVINWLGANFVRQVKRCWACDHTAEFHDEEGCWYTFEHGIPGQNPVCPCPIPRGASGPMP